MKEMKNFWKNIVKRKHYINDIYIIGIFILILLNLVLFVFKSTNKKRFIYVDMYNSTGASENCFYDNYNREYRCYIPVKVKQYVEE